MKLYIFSDVVCTWSWGEEKVIRALDYIYDGNIKIKNIMGGMISDYHDILPMNMKDKDSDETANAILKQIWQAGSGIHKMPVMQESPNLLSRQNPSTNKLDKIFIAAREVDEEKSNKFLRLLREATILDNINTMDLNNIFPLLEKSDIDKDEFLENMENVDEKFLEDRMSNFDRRFETFPNFMYVNENRKEFILKGYKNKKELIDFISEHSNMQPKQVEKSEDEVLKFTQKYKRSFLPEFYEVFEDEKFVDQTLENLQLQNKIKINKLNETSEIISN